MSTLIRRIPSLSRASINETAHIFAADGFYDLIVYCGQGAWIKLVAEYGDFIFHVLSRDGTTINVSTGAGIVPVVPWNYMSTDAAVMVVRRDK